NRTRFPLALGDPNDIYYTQKDNNLPLDPANATWFKWDAHLIDCVGGWSIWPGSYPTAANSANGAVRIAVIASGVDYEPPDFVLTGGTDATVAHGGKLDRSLDVSIINGTVTPDAWDVFGHGTHVTGIAAAATNNNSVGVTGNGLNAKVMSLRVIDAAG